VITDLNLTIPVGKTTAVIGPSGSGKSTVVDLATGLILPKSGSVFIDACPLEPSQVRLWRTHIGYVPQDTFLFHDSIRQNLLWARPDATEEDIQEALRLAAADEFVARLPHGLDTVVGDRGVRLSGGERQRIALARALLRKPSLLVLDEATSNIDSDSENRILNAVHELHGSITILIISHRLSTVRDADMIYVLESGRLVESAPWSTLATMKHGHLRALARLQELDLAM
jgi:ATP-binding cassette subfamily C protein